MCSHPKRTEQDHPLMMSSKIGLCSQCQRKRTLFALLKYDKHSRQVAGIAAKK